MFGKRKQPETKTQANSGRITRPAAPSAEDRPAGPPSRPDASAVLNRQASTPATPVVPARPGETRAATQPQRPEPAAANGEGKRLIVGREIRLVGEVKNCEKLVVEGEVEATLTATQGLEIAKSGVFKGDGSIDVADISGRFEGDLTVKGCLTIRSSGKVTGKLRYGELEIERGGRLSGDVGLNEEATPEATTETQPASAESAQNNGKESAAPNGSATPPPKSETANEGKSDSTSA